MKWSIVYKSATKNQKSIWSPDIEEKDLIFPKKLSLDFLRSAHKTMGSYVYANQYDNVVIPDEHRTFKKEWFKHYDAIPAKTHTFIMIDPAISTADTADYTGVIVLKIDELGRQYVILAKRYKVNPTKIIHLMFDLYFEYRPLIIGVESVAYQKSLIHFAVQEMNIRGVFLPIKEVNPPTNKTKETKILGLVPFFEWGNMFLNKGLDDLEMEALTFPRGAHDDLIDALASAQQFVYKPQPEETKDVKPAQGSPRYEEWYIRSLRNPKTSSDTFE